MRKLYFLLLTIMITSVSLGQDLLISGVYDGPLTGGTPKGVELYVVNDIADLSLYGIGSANNGGGTDGEEFTFPADAATAGDYIYITNNSTEFANFFGFAANYTDGSMGINGDDAVELFFNGSVTDTFGDINTDGSGQPWDYLDGWAYRVDGTGPDGVTFVLANWSFSGINVFDGQTSNATSPNPLPIGTYSPTASTTPTISITGSVSSLDYFENNGPSAEQSFNVSGLNLTQDITVTAPANFEVADAAVGPYGPSTTVTQTGGTANSTPVYVRLASGLTSNTYTGDITASSTGATNETLALTGTVSPDVPQFSVFGTPGALNYAVGAGPSNEETISVEGLFLNSNITVTAPANFEVSLTSGSGYSSSVIVPQAGGTVPNTDVFIRLSAGLAVGPYSGDITVSSPPAADQTVAVSGDVFGAATNALVLVGAYDGPLTGGTPKGIELVALADIPDLSVFGISSVTNGAGSSAGTVEYNFPADAVTAGDRIFLATEGTQFANFFGFAPTYIDNVVGINGDDAIELYEGATIIDTFGDVNMDGTGQAWEYLDGWAYRVSNTGPDGTFVVANWTFSGPNALDGEADNATAATPYPIAVYTNDALSVESFNQSNFNVYPNPTNTGFVNITTTNSDDVNVTVFDILGKQVLKETLNNNTLNVSNLKSGVYILNIKQNNATVTKKLVIQ
ncbi:T9SS type A sorting domain-containing protein [Olleya sp. YS]|uniref:T9SS type A sorting domain-containing protein n=1 Tax=Olleya sp. YS TaxID=3028318 RepID=UPI0024343982|nr:T9SS type A sorting domain-containing protein [Olleya sp. YS]WGD35537.1 T9SS type A sorting domain-containing protein [Olleya sp. YS]